jgi:hypothetical protein
MMGGNQGSGKKGFQRLIGRGQVTKGGEGDDDDGDDALDNSPSQSSGKPPIIRRRRSFTLSRSMMSGSAEKNVGKGTSFVVAEAIGS